MKALITGTSGHLGEALARRLRDNDCDVVGVDLLESPYTQEIGSIADRALVKRCLSGVDAVLHAATLHKPHILTHSARRFIETNVTGTLVLLEESALAGVKSFVFTSTTSVFGRELTPETGEPAAWITEEVSPAPRNIYGVTKRAAEDLCELSHRSFGLPCLVLRTSRFFPEEDDRADIRDSYDDANVKVNELLYRRVDLEDAVNAHMLAMDRAPTIGFGRYIISATAPFSKEDLMELRRDAPSVVHRYFTTYEEEYNRRGWRMFPSIDRVYVNARAREELGWKPRHDFGFALERLRKDQDFKSALACAVGSKGYHSGKIKGGRYPTE